MAQSRGKGNVLTDKEMTEEEKHALGKTGAGLLETPTHAHLPRNVQKACQDDAFVRAVQTELRLKKPPARGLLETAIKRYRAQPKEKKPPRRRQPPKRRPPKKRGPPSPKPPPPAKLSKQAPAPAKPAPLADQNAHAGALVVAPAAAPSQLAQFHAAIERADKARKGEKTVSRVKSDPRPKACKMRRVGDAEYRTFASQKDAAAAFGLTRQDVSRLCDNTATTTLSAQFEARDADEGVSMSKRQHYASVLRAGGFRFNNSDVGSDAGAFSVVQRGAWVRSPPRSWEAALKRFGEFSEEDWRKFVAATGEAEAARVDQMELAFLRSGAASLAVKRRAGTTGHDGYVDEDYDFERAEREDREAELDRLRKTDAPDWKVRVAEDEIKARRRRAWWREHKQRVGSPNGYFASL